MGKIKLKLSHVMPHIWFSKPKGAVKAQDASTPHYTSSSLPAVNGSIKPLYKSPVNHKAIDISFPSETPKRSPLNDLPVQKEGNADLNFPPHTFDVSSDCSSRLVFSFGRTLDMDPEREDCLPRISSASENKLSGRGPSFDMNELERRLKTLGPEDRRKYYSSPMFSMALPTPRLEGAPREETLDMVNDASGDGGMHPLQVGYEVGRKPYADGSHNKTPNESTSFGQSTSSSSDTAFERASSSMWERDVLSFTSEGSEAMTSAGDDSNYARNKKPKEKVNAAASSPFMYGNADKPKSNQNDRSAYKSFARESKVSTIKYRVEDSHHGRPGGVVENRQFQANQPLSDHEEESSLPLACYESDDQIKIHQKISRKDFSYADSKERLLSARSSFEGINERALSESEIETISNYSKFKLKQRHNAGRNHSHALQKSSSQHSYTDQYKDWDGKFDNLTHNNVFGGGNRTAYGKNTGEMGKSSAGGSMLYQGTLKAMKEKTGGTILHQFSNAEAHGSKVFDSYAMVKWSYDPRQDFKESMIEMIIEKELCSPKDMVELLQCYLTLNSEIYHDAIVKVSREVWSELFQQEGI